MPKKVPEIGDILENVAKGYSTYLAFPELTQQEVKRLGEVVEDTSLRLEEFNTILDTVKNDSVNVFTLLPQFIESTNEIQKMYSQIEEVEKFIREVSESIKLVEDQVGQSEYSYNLVQRQRTINSFGLGGLTSKYIPSLKTANAMPPFHGLKTMDILSSLQAVYDKHDNPTPQPIPSDQPLVNNNNNNNNIIINIDNNDDKKEELDKNDNKNNTDNININNNDNDNLINFGP